jgi:hypothetical protein
MNARLLVTLCLSVSAVSGPALARPGLAAPAQNEDRAGSSDPAFLPRYEGAVIRSYRQPSVDEIAIPVGPVADEDNPRSVELLEGDVSHIDYRIAPAVSPLAVERHYRSAFEAAGYEIVFACQGETACGRDMASFILNSGHVAPRGLADGIFSDRIRVLVARQGRDWVLMHVNDGPDAARVYVATVGDGVAPQ